MWKTKEKKKISASHKKWPDSEQRETEKPNACREINIFSKTQVQAYRELNPGEDKEHKAKLNCKQSWNCIFWPMCKMLFKSETVRLCVYLTSRTQDCSKQKEYGNFLHT